MFQSLGCASARAHIEHRGTPQGNAVDRHMKQICKEMKQKTKAARAARAPQDWAIFLHPSMYTRRGMGGSGAAVLRLSSLLPQELRILHAIRVCAPDRHHAAVLVHNPQMLRLGLRGRFRRAQHAA